MNEIAMKPFLIVLAIALIFVIVAIVSFYLLYKRRNDDLVLENEISEKYYEQEISKAQIENREETFRNISWELHDNIGQLLTLAKIQLQTNTDTNEVIETLNKSIKELRGLSKIINPEVLKNMSLVEAITHEINRFNRLDFIKSSINVAGKQINIDGKVEIVFFRILQEFFSNTIKHAKATHLYLELNYFSDKLIIIARDNGLGFDMNNYNNSGIGLINMKSRAKLVNAEAEIESKPKQGTKITITYPF